MFDTLAGLFRCSTRSSLQKPDSPPLHEVSTESTTLERVPNCVFCDVTKEKGFDIVWENDSFIVFNDHRPAAARHLLVIPRRHIDSVKTLKEDDASLVREMADIGHRMLDMLEVQATPRRLGFHIPPFNSVLHLHLHVQAPPYKSIFQRAKYLVVQGSGKHVKGFSWFAEVDQTIMILEEGRHIGVFPC